MLIFAIPSNIPAGVQFALFAFMPVAPLSNNAGTEMYGGDSRRPDVW